MSDPIVLIDKKLRIRKRKGSNVWQVYYCIEKGTWDKKTSGEVDVDKAKEAAFKIYYGAEERKKQGQPATSRSFKAVAKAAVDRMETDFTNGVGKPSFNDYISVINRLLTPYFKSKNISKLTTADFKEWAKWRDDKIAQDKLEKTQKAAINKAKTPQERKAANAMKKVVKPATKSTVNTHNAAIKRVFDEAEANGWVTKSTRPTLPNKGAKGSSRPSFTRDEYRKITNNLHHFIRTGHRKFSTELREVMREYVLFVANTGIRPGTEADNLKWSNLEWVTTSKKETYLAVNVDGKTKHRQLIARDNTTKFLQRLLDMNPNLKFKTVDEAIAAKVDEPLFVGSSGKQILHEQLAKSFEVFLTKYNLLKGGKGDNRTLYSLRHMYATFALDDETNIYDLAVQMGTSVKMIEQHYSKMRPVMKAGQLSGRNKAKKQKAAKKKT
jgi:integrase